MMRWMRIVGLVSLGLALGYYYRGSEPMLAVQRIFSRPCAEPLPYTVVSIDPGFGLSRVELDEALMDAEALWENTLGRDLFASTTATTSGVVQIRMVFDERQANTTREQALRTTISVERSELASMQNKREALMEDYETLLASYNELRVAYERKLAAYNKEVQRWNAEGGAPASVYEELNHQGALLDADMKAIVGLGNELKDVVAQLNTYAAEINMRIDAYNDLVEGYNDTFHDHSAFAQGTYFGTRSIDIYQYSTYEDLRIVLAHELGHALGLGHVEGDTSIMYEKTGKQSLIKGLSTQDIAHAREVCGVVQE